MKRFIFLLCILCTQIITAQESEHLKNHVFKINILAPSLEYELKISSKTTLDFKLGTGFLINGGSGKSTEWSFFPFGELQYRYFYNLEKRLARGKSIANNSGNYLALISTFQGRNPLFKDKLYDNSLVTTVGPVWGIQRTPGKSFTYGIQLGIGYQFRSYDDNQYVPMIGFDLGWIIS